MGKSARSDRKRRITVFNGRNLRTSDLPSEDNALATFALRADGLSGGDHRKAETIALWVTGGGTYPTDFEAQVSLLKSALLKIGVEHISAIRATSGGRPQTWPFERRLQLLQAVDGLLAIKQVETSTAALEHLRKHNEFLATFQCRRLANILAQTRREVREKLLVLGQSISELEGDIRSIEGSLALERKLGFRKRRRSSDLTACLLEDTSYEEFLAVHFTKLHRLSRKP